jgi:hypothetical protein
MRWRHRRCPSVVHHFADNGPDEVDGLDAAHLLACDDVTQLNQLDIPEHALKVTKMAARESWLSDRRNYSGGTSAV